MSQNPAQYEMTQFGEVEECEPSIPEHNRDNRKYEIYNVRAPLFFKQIYLLLHFYNSFLLL